MPAPRGPPPHVRPRGPRVYRHPPRRRAAAARIRPGPDLAIPSAASFRLPGGAHRWGVAPPRSGHPGQRSESWDERPLGRVNWTGESIHAGAGPTGQCDSDDRRGTTIDGRPLLPTRRRPPPTGTHSAPGARPRAAAGCVPARPAAPPPPSRRLDRGQPPPIRAGPPPRCPVPRPRSRPPTALVGP